MNNFFKKLSLIFIFSISSFLFGMQSDSFDSNLPNSSQEEFRELNSYCIRSEDGSILIGAIDSSDTEKITNGLWEVYSDDISIDNSNEDSLEEFVRSNSGREISNESKNRAIKKTKEASTSRLKDSLDLTGKVNSVYSSGSLKEKREMLAELNDELFKIRNDKKYFESVGHVKSAYASDGTRFRNHKGHPVLDKIVRTATLDIIRVKSHRDSLAHEKRVLYEIDKLNNYIVDEEFKISEKRREREIQELTKVVARVVEDKNIIQSNELHVVDSDLSVDVIGDSEFIDNVSDDIQSLDDVAVLNIVEEIDSVDKEINDYGLEETNLIADRVCLDQKVSVVSNQRIKLNSIKKKISNGLRSVKESVKNVALAAAPVVGEAIADGFESGFRELAQECFRANREAEEQLKNPAEFLRNQMNDIDTVALDHTFTPLRREKNADYSSDSYTREQEEVSERILTVDREIESIYSDINKYGYSEQNGLHSKEYLNNVCRVSHDGLDLAMSFCNENHLDTARNLTNFSTVLLDSTKASINLLKVIARGAVDGGQDFIDRYRGNPALLLSDVGYATATVLFPEIMFAKFIFDLARQGYLVASDFSNYKKAAYKSYESFYNLPFEDKIFVSTKIGIGFLIQNLVYKKNFKLVRKTKGFLINLKKFAEEESKIVKSVSRTLKLKDKVIKKALSPIGSAVKGSGSNVGVVTKYGVKNSQNALGVISRNTALATLEDSLSKNLELILLNRKWNMKGLIHVCKGNFKFLNREYKSFGLISGMHTEKALKHFLKMCRIDRSELIIEKLRNGVKVVKIPKEFISSKMRSGRWDAKKEFCIKTLWPEYYTPKKILLAGQDILRQGVNGVNKYGKVKSNMFIGKTKDGIKTVVYIDGITGFIKTVFPIYD